MGTQNRRKRFFITVGSVVAILTAFIFGLVSLNIPFDFVRPADSQTAILLFVLSMLVSLAFVVFGFILARSIVKLYIERRAGVLGSKFKFKLVAGALALSLLPVVFLFYSSYVLMNRTVDKWFRQPFEKVARDTGEIVSQFSEYASRKTIADARSTAAALSVASAATERPLASERALAEAARLHGVDYLAWITPEGRLGARFPTAGPDLLLLVGPVSRSGAGSFSRLADVEGTKLAVAVVPMEPGDGWLIAANRLPDTVSQKLEEMEREFRIYQRLHPEFKDLRKVYIYILALVTVIILFITTWGALFLSKQVTVPIQSLAEATQELSLGHLDHRVQTEAVDELAVLVESFNQMTGQLEANRRQLEASRSEQERANAELDQRRRSTETILESIPTGVVSLSPRRDVLKINPAVERLLGSAHARAARQLGDLFPTEPLRELEHLLKRSDRLGNATSQFELATANGTRSVAITGSALQHPSSHPRGREQNLGYILVLEDMSDLLHAQQAAAWREVARRIAHEIKNPLTPIALSAERIRRHVERAQTGPSWGERGEETLRVLSECSGLIDREVATLKSLVDEFAQLARFPAVRLVPSDLNAVVENAIVVFDGRLDGIRVKLDLCPNLPPVDLDPDQFKRVVINLVGNAAEAMEDSLVRELRISTADLRGEAVEVTLADTGHGVGPELKEKLFLPYFSTKERGTGLGLAIVNRIITDHNGSIRVEENRPVGSRFIIELPV